MTPTEKFVRTLESLEPGSLGRLRSLGGRSLDESVEGFDLFTGIWWPLREQNQRAPRREVAWLVAKVYAYRPMRQCKGARLAMQLGNVKGESEPVMQRRQAKFDELLLLPLTLIEPALCWALDLIAKDSGELDWVRLTDELSAWEREETRLNWATQYLHFGQ